MNSRIDAIDTPISISAASYSNRGAILAVLHLGALFVVASASPEEWYYCVSVFWLDVMFTISALGMLLVSLMIKSADNRQVVIDKIAVQGKVPLLIKHQWMLISIAILSSYVLLTAGLVYTTIVYALTNLLLLHFWRQITNRISEHNNTFLE